ncbi:MAG: helix-turn-helix domain-containing protein [Gallionellaceae bacterium]|nr:helix-turn-helix domain-containing protein [Gallionellaceae bacterium]
MSHEELFGHLASDNFTAQEAAEYLEVSMSTFRRFVASGKLNPSSTVGRNQLFAVSDLKAFKKALKTARG